MINVIFKFANIMMIGLCTLVLRDVLAGQLNPVSIMIVVLYGLVSAIGGLFDD